jgi:hypothetical protein
MMPRFFTLQQAEKVLPGVASPIRQAIEDHRGELRGELPN